MTLRGRQTKHAAIAPLLLMLLGSPGARAIAPRIHAMNVNLTWRV